MRTITATKDYSWIQNQEGEFVWPSDVEIVFLDGETWDHTGGRDKYGDSILYNPEGTGAIGSPCHQLLIDGGAL